MNREIKFRGLRTDGKGWVYGALWQNKGGSLILKLRKTPELTPIKGTLYDLLFDFYSVIPESVGQFTGLKDRNGIDIYEGDKLEIMGGLRYDVVFDLFQFCVSNGRIMYGFNQVKSEQTVVIGNIHESEVK